MRKLTCAVGDKFGYWTIIGPTFTKSSHTYVPVQCKCGKIANLCLSDLVHGRAHSCKSCAAQDRGHINELHIGDKIKRWTIIDGPRVYNSNVQFKVQCECGSQRWIQPNELLNPNKCYSCIKCAHKQPDILFPTQFGRIKRSAEARNIEFNVSIEYLWELWEKQNGCCAITGDPLDSIRKASLDRIDSSKGYIEGNVQWVTYRANVSKHTMTMDELYSFCKKVLNHANQQPSIGLTTNEGSETNG
jgi:hypothetical protein